jgi:hypothetical protein
MNKEIIELNTEEALDLAIEKAELMNPAMQLKVTSDPTFKQASEYMGQVREVKKFLKEKKDSVLKPLKLAKESFEGMFEKPENMVEEVETYLKGQISDYGKKLLLEEDKRVREAAKKIELGTPVEIATKNIETITRKIDAIPMHTVWNVEIIDFAKVPDEYKILNESKAKATGKLGFKIEGLKIWSEEKVKNLF